jgi:hypothetical protein
MTYEPDDSGLTIEGLSYLEANPALMAAAEEVAQVTAAEVTRLRKQWPADFVRMALTVARARRKARNGGKFEGLGELWGMPEAVEQATGTRVARHKAVRFADYFSEFGKQTSAANVIWDICAGIGGDARELERVAAIQAVDMSPVRLWCLMKNCGPRVRPVCRKVDEKLAEFLTTSAVRGAAFHCDPARRSAGTRKHHWEDMEPGPVVLETLIERFSAGAIKLSPAVDFKSLPGGEVEVISTDGSVVQAVLWLGGLRRYQRSATVMRGAASVTVEGEPGRVEVPGPAEKFVYEIDGAVHRAGLAQNLTRALRLNWLAKDGGYVTAEQLVEHLALTRFTHIETIAYSEKNLLETLRKLPASDRAVEIKTRGGVDIDTDLLQVKLTKAAPCGATVMIYRGHAGGATASICRREV